jgi:PAS domain S-box-containing protein
MTSSFAGGHLIFTPVLKYIVHSLERKVYIIAMISNNALGLKIFWLATISLLLIFISQYLTENKGWLVILDNLHWTLGHVAAFSMAWIGLMESQNAKQLVARRCFFIGLAFYLVGQLLWNFQVYIGRNTFPALSDIGYLALGPCCLWGFISFKRLTPTEHDFLLLLLDFAMMSVSILALTLVIYLNNNTADNLIELSIMSAYPVSLLGAFCFGLLLMLHVRPKLNWSWIFFLIGIGSEGLLWMSWNLKALDNTNVDGSLLNQLFSVVAVTVGVSAMRWQMDQSSNIQYEKWCEAVLRILPLAGVGIAVSAYLWILSSHDILPVIQNIVLYICGIVFILAMLRQSIMLKEREQLLIAQRLASQSMLLLRTVVETIPARVFWKDHDSNYLGCNTAFATDAGFKSSDELIGKSDYEMAWASHAELYRADDRYVLETGEAKLLYEEPQVGASGQKIWLRTSKVPLKDQDGNSLGVLGIYDDITEYKVREFELRLAAVAFETQEGIMVTDANCLILRVNKAFTKITGYFAEDVIGLNPRILSSGRHDKNFYDQMWSSIRDAGGWEGEVFNRRKSGEIYLEYLNITAVKDIAGEVVNYVGTLTDITYRKESASKLEKLADELVLRDLLVREVHHRIKNNLHSVTLLLSNFADNHPELEHILNQAATQVQSIGVVHGLKGQFSLYRVDLYELIYSLTKEIQSIWNNKILVDVQSGWWNCDIDKSEAVPLALVINELITNAIKHGQYGQHVKISLDGQVSSRTIKIEIVNVGLLPKGFTLNPQDYLGTGLQLVMSLLPRSGVKLTWSQSESAVITQLVLEYPLIRNIESI